MRAALMVFVLATVALSWASAPSAARVHRGASGVREAAAASRPWSAVLHGADGRALARAAVLARVPGADVPEAWRTMVTDDAGRLRLDGADAGGRVTIRLDSCTLELAQSDAFVHLGDFVPLEVEAVDGATGAVLPGAVRNPPSHLARGAYRSVDFGVVVPEGYLAPVAGAGASHVSRHAERVRLAACLRREADIRLRVLDAAGEPVAAAEVTEVFVAGPEPSSRPWLEIPEPPDEEDLDFFEGPTERANVTWRAAPTDREGWTRVRGIPQLLDEQYWIIAGDGQREGFAGVRIDSFGERHVRDVRLPEAATEVWQDSRLAGWSRSFG